MASSRINPSKKAIEKLQLKASHGKDPTGRRVGDDGYHMIEPPHLMHKLNFGLPQHDNPIIKSRNCLDFTKLLMSNKG